MMDHIINFDWNYREPEKYFIKPEDLDNSVTERILRNKFRDPLISSEDEADDNKPLVKIDWDKVFSDSEKSKRNQRVYIPGLTNPQIRYLKLSAMTLQQHQQSLKVVFSQYPHKKQLGYVPRPDEEDIKVYEEIKEIYEKERQEFIEWGKVLWISDHCRRALRPKPRVESVYEACFKMKAAQIQSLPKTLRVAAQIAFESTTKENFEMIHQKDLIMVNIDELPELEQPINITEKVTIMKPSPIPEPCPVHPCKFILPTEKSVTDKPLTGVHRSLSQLAVEHAAAAVLAESALRCLLERDRNWTLPVSVVDTFGADGEPCNVVVVGSEFPLLKEPAPTRTYRAFKHMLDMALISHKEMPKLRYSNVEALLSTKREDRGAAAAAAPFRTAHDASDGSSDEDEHAMVIDADDDVQLSSPKAKKQKGSAKQARAEAERPSGARKSLEGCTCKGTLFEFPPPRSYRKWRVQSSSSDSIDVIVHCAHKFKVQGRRSELLLEPIPEYQLDVGASEQPASKVHSLELALRLRRDAKLANVRIDGVTGDIVVFEYYTAAQHVAQRGTQWPQLAAALHHTLRQLRGLLPGSYVLKHEPSHGANALLYASRSRSGETLVLRPDCGRLQHPDEARAVIDPPTLIPALLPMHKHRRQLPLAFTYYANMVAPEPRRPVTRQKTPPQALQWPKRKGKGRKRKRQS